MALALEIEYLTGVCFAAIGPDSEAPDWPPQPDRVFSALVATWGAHGEPDDERQALEWLERLSPPLCDAKEAAVRAAPAVFVPPNDPRSDRAKSAAGVLPGLRSRQPRRFPAVRPHDPVVRYVWDDEPDAATFDALQFLARDTAYVGHSASLTRCCFFRSDAVAHEALNTPRRRVYRGRLDELRQAYGRFRQSADRKDRPNYGEPVVPQSRPMVQRANVFSDQWLILEHVAGRMPDVRAAPVVARTLRKALMSGYGRLDRPVPIWLSGHDADGSPTREPHLAIVPMSFTGSPHADGRVLGFALVPPAGTNLLDDEDFRSALRQLAPWDEALGRRLLEVKSEKDAAPDKAFALYLSPSFEPLVGRHSLDPALYCGRAQTFATVTPIVLDRYLKKKGEAREQEIADQIVDACHRIGLPAPQAVIPDKHAALEGAPSAYPSGKAPRWLNWRLPPALAGRPLVHAAIRFAEPVEGPLLLGAGRFLGLGLCRTLDGGKG